MTLSQCAYRVELRTLLDPESGKTGEVEEYTKEGELPIALAFAGSVVRFALSETDHETGKPISNLILVFQGCFWDDENHRAVLSSVNTVPLNKSAHFRRCLKAAGFATSKNGIIDNAGD